MKLIMVIELLVMHFWSETIRVIYSHFEIAEFSLPIFIWSSGGFVEKQKQKGFHISFCARKQKWCNIEQKKMVRFNTSSPNIHIQILQTYLYAFRLRRVERMVERIKQKIKAFFSWWSFYYFSLPNLLTMYGYR